MSSGLNTRAVVIGGIIVFAIGGFAVTKMALMDAEPRQQPQNDIIIPANHGRELDTLPNGYAGMQDVVAPVDPIVEEPPHDPPPPPPRPPQQACEKPPLLYGPDHLGAAPADWNSYRYCQAIAAYQREMYDYQVKYGQPAQQGGGFNGGQHGGGVGNQRVVGGPGMGQQPITPAQQVQPASAGAGSMISSGASGTGRFNGESRDRHEDFAARASADAALYHQSSPEEMPVDECVIPAGNDIPVLSDNTINMALPGTARLRVSRDVMDFTGSARAIPAHSTITIKYDHQVQHGQNRAQLAAAILTMPDGRTMSMGGLGGYDPTGGAGIPIDVNNHFLRTLGVGVLGSLIDAIPAFAGLRADVQIGGVAEDASSIGRDLFEREFNIPPEVDPIPAGTEMLIRVDQHIIMGECYDDL